MFEEGSREGEKRCKGKMPVEKGRVRGDNEWRRESRLHRNYDKTTGKMAKSELMKSCKKD